MTDLTLPKRPKESVPIQCDGPFVAVHHNWQIAPPQDSLVLMVKSTLSIIPGAEAVFLDDPPGPTGDVFEEDDPKHALKYASDFAPFKPKADVLLVGHAYPPAPKARVTNVQLAFGSLHASLAAIGDRKWESAGSTEPEPFDCIPLRHERAFGGSNIPDNPIGVGAEGRRLPNLERPDELIRSQHDRPMPACFAPIPPNFRVRSSKLGSYDKAWLRERWPYFPLDFDWSHFNVAPTELQIPYPRGDETFSLAGVHPTLQVVSGRLPGIVPRAFAQTTLEAGQRFLEIKLSLDTIHFDTDALTLTLVWRGNMPVSHEHAPELARIYVTADRVGALMPIEELRERFVATLPLPQVNAPTAEPAANKEPTQSVPRAPAVAREALEAMVASGQSLEGARLFQCDLSGLDLRGKNLAGAFFGGANLDGAQFEGADLRGALLQRASCKGANFRNAKIDDANLSDADVTGANFSGASLKQATLSSAEAEQARFVGACLVRMNGTKGVFRGATFDEADLTSADLSEARLDGASFRKAKLDDAQAYEASGEGCFFDEASLLRFRGDDSVFAKSSFERANATGASLNAARLDGANFRNAILDEAVLAHATMEGAVMHRASAKGARCKYAKMIRVQAIQANFMEANFEGADLSGADLRGANLYAVETWKAKLDGALLDQALVAGSKLEG